MNRKGDLEMQQVVIIILAIIGFVILLYFLIKLDLGTSSEEELCRLSVLTRATAPEAAQNYVPLECTTKKICLSYGGKCAESFAGEKDVLVVKLDKKDEKKSIELIEKTSAEEMYKCWSMMGKGKLDIYWSYAKSRGLTERNSGPLCVICSRVAVDKEVSSELTGKVKIQDYMAKTKVSGSGLTYLQTFTDEQVQAYPVLDSAVLDANYEKHKGVTGSIDFTGSHQREFAFIFMQMKSQDFGTTTINLLKDTAVLSGGAFTLIAGITGPVKAARLFSLASPAAPFIAATGVGVSLYSEITSNGQRLLAAGYCGALTGEPLKGDWFQSGQPGCSIVQASPYSAKAVNQLCMEIEGKP